MAVVPRSMPLTSHQELKVVDTANATYLCDTVGTVTLIGGVATGNDFTDRVGRKVLWKSVLINGYVQPQDATADASLSRVMLVYDSQANGALATIANILTAVNVNSPNNLNNRDRFKVIMDKRVTTGFYNTTATSSVADKTIAEVRKFKKLNLETIFGGTTAGIASIQSGALLLVTIGSNAAGLATNLFATVRCRFVDA